MLARRALVLLAAAVTALMSASASPAQTPELEVVAPDEIALTVSGDESSKTSIWVRNASGGEIKPAFALTLEDGDGDAVDPGRIDVVLVDDEDDAIAPEALAPLDAYSVDRYRFFLRGSDLDEDLSGQLVVSGGNVAPGFVSLSAGEKSAANRGVNIALVSPFVAALILMLIVWLVDKPKLRDPLGTLDLDFKTSFASTLTAVGALLGLAISASVLPDDTVNLSKEAFVALNLTFGVAIVVAGLVYSAMQRPIWVEEGTPPKKVRKLRGYVGPFFLACLITVWAVFGELWTLWLLVDELGQDKGFTEFAVGAFKAMLVVSAVAMVFYTVWRMHSIVDADAGPTDTAEESPTVERLSLL